MRLGRKNQFSQAANLGVKQVGGAGRLAYKHSEGIEKTAGLVSDVAGKASGVLATGATLAALTGLGAPVAAGLGSASAAAGTLSAGAGYVRKGAQGVNRVKDANRKIDQFLG